MVHHPAHFVLWAPVPAAAAVRQAQRQWTQRSTVNNPGVISSRGTARVCEITRSLERKTRRMRQQPFVLRGSGSAFAALAALVTTLCCLGFPALVGFLSALGAGFLINDRYLEPLLAGTLLLTLVIVGFHLRRHHQPGPFILSLLAAGSVFFAIYGIGLLPHASSGDHMADGMAPTPVWSLFLASVSILVLLAAQVWDLWLFRRCARASLVSPQTRKEDPLCQGVTEEFKGEKPCGNTAL
jgi:mercuric ion transport protein